MVNNSSVARERRGAAAIFGSSREERSRLLSLERGACNKLYTTLFITIYNLLRQMEITVLIRRFNVYLLVFNMNDSMMASMFNPYFFRGSSIRMELF
jgi:hypothetical protein